MDVTVQPSLWRQKAALWNPPGNATTVPGVFGILAPVAIGTATARNVATTNLLTRMKRFGYVSAATAGAVAGHYSNKGQFTIGSSSDTLGGFFYAARFGISDASIVTSGRTFVGLSSSVAAATNVSPSTLLNSVGIGTDGGTGLYLFFGGSAAQTPIPLTTLGNITNTDAYEITLFAPVGSNNLFYKAERISDGVFIEGQVPGVYGTAYPSHTTLLSHRAWRSNNAELVAVGIDIISFYIETDQ